MKCQHCNTENSRLLPFGRAIEGGRAYAQSCEICGRVLGLRPRVETDPPATPPDLTDAQAARLLFLRWRLNHGEVQASIAGPADDPLTAA
jgi:hypothetical protein